MFKRKKNIQPLSERPAPFQQIGDRLLKKQHQLARWMQVKTRHWKRGQQKVFLLILCLILGGMSTYRILELFSNHGTSAPSDLVKQQPLPSLIHPTAPTPVPSAQSDTTVFRRFHRHLDSLLKTQEGRRQYQQFLKNRPGFLDSLAFAEKLSDQLFPQH